MDFLCNVIFCLSAASFCARFSSFFLMGCAFSSTQIFVIGNDGRANTGMAQSFMMQMRKGFHRPTKTGTSALMLAHGKGGNRDIVLVGQNKSNGIRRRPSSEARFIEHRARLSSSFWLGNGQPNGRLRNGHAATLAPSPMAHRSSRDLASSRKSSKANSGTNAGGHTAFGLIDFQKRLERLKTRRQENGNGGNEVGEEEMNNERLRPNGNGMPNTQKLIEADKRKKAPPVEPLIVNHIPAVEEGAEQAADFATDCDGWRECDESSAADALSIQQQASTAAQQMQLHDGDVSEASFILVKKRLKVAWEHRQFQQMRKMSLLRREMCCGVVVVEQDTKMNNWIPEIAQQEEEWDSKCRLEKI